MKILLASNSPRRKELLQNLRYRFEVVTVNCEEVYPPSLAPAEIAGYLSILKADSFRELQPDEILITADTIVALEDEVLGKPENTHHAQEMLQKLSGKTHQVYTGITIKTLNKTITETDCTEVEVAPISEEEAAYYIQNHQPFDKAGSYGVQEWLGMAKINRINGSYYTVMGLPTHLVYKILKDFEASH